MEDIDSSNGILQGNNISPMIFSIYLNGLLQELSKSEGGVKLSENEVVSVLAYVDDIVLLSETESGLQKLLNVVEK